MTTPELRAAAELMQKYEWRVTVGVGYGVMVDCHESLPTLLGLADFAAAILARLSDAEVGEILQRETRNGGNAGE